MAQPPPHGAKDRLCFRLFSYSIRMRRGKKPSSEPKKRINIYVREDLFLRFQLLHLDNKKGKAEYGSFSEIVNTLLEDYLNLKEQTIDEWER